jgi:ABC-type nitrate/sulfonate/bicarbonate transport system substrate-binding protein/signal transduction histidine kinase
MWLDQFEFAGFYVAKEKGFYKDLGLEVNLKKFDSNINIVQEVLDKKTTFGTSSSSLIIDKSLGKDIVLLGSIFQSSPLILLALKNSNIKNISDIKNKKIMLTKDQQLFATLQAMLSSKNIQLSDTKILDHSFNVNDLINKKTDLMLAYTTNEPFQLKEKGYGSQIFHPKDYGFDFYEELIFTSKDFANNNPKIVKDFYDASIKGWQYAFDNIEEVSKLIFEKYNPQKKSLKSLIFEAKEMKKLVYDKEGQIGTITKERVNLIKNSYQVMGLLNNDINIDELIYTSHLPNNISLNDKEKEYLQKKKIIKMCIDPNWMPLEKIENGQHIGISAEYIKLIEKKIDIPIKLISTDSWNQSLQYAKEKKCDILSLIMETPQRKTFLNFTKPYVKIPLVIATGINTTYIENFSLLKNKKIGIIRGYAYAEILKIKYPNIEFVDVENIEEGLTKLEREDVFGFIDSLTTLGYSIQKDYIGQLKIAGKFDENWNLSIGVRNDEIILKEILDKAIEDISTEQVQGIFNKWISINYEKSINYAFLIKTFIFLIVFILVIFLVYRQYLLKKLNNKLNDKIKEEMIKNEEKNRILIQQSRMASMGEMLENIAHQWRQPLSTISMATTGIEIRKEMGTLNDNDFSDSINHIKHSTQFLSETIDSFRNFFNQEKEQKTINIKTTIEKTLELLGVNLSKNDILFIKDIEEHSINTLENELIQVLMNIIINAKDALNNNENEKLILINVYMENDKLIICIKDNAGGIEKSIIDKIFEPYFTTKHQFKGTGIGLYMSKIMVEKHLFGEIKVKNNEFEYLFKKYIGAEFTLSLPIS